MVEFSNAIGSRKVPEVNCRCYQSGIFGVNNNGSKTLDKLHRGIMRTIKITADM